MCGLKKGISMKPILYCTIFIITIAYMQERDARLMAQTTLSGIKSIQTCEIHQFGQVHRFRCKIGDNAVIINEKRVKNEMSVM
jgi:hypothetical protein